jgi:SAM-dependent methyltransferase
VEAGVEALPFAAAQFDAIASADVLYHVEDDNQALREFFRVLKPGGVVVLNVPAYRWLWSYHDEAVQSRRRYGRRELLLKLRNAGFVQVKTTFWNTLLFPLIVIRRKALPRPKSGSDVALGSDLTESLFNRVMALERGWLRAVAPLPFGSSIFAVARKV